MKFFEVEGLNFSEAEVLGGDSSREKVEAIKKSLGMDYTMGSTDQTGGAAIRHESLEKTLKWTEANETSPAFWKAVKKGKAKAAVEEFAILDDIAQGQSYTEFTMPEDPSGTLKRDIEQVKLVGIIGKVSYFAKSNDTLQDAETVETRIKTVSLLKTLDHQVIRGDAAKNPSEPNGIIKQAKSRMKYPTQNVINMKGKRLRPEEFADAGQIIADNFGNPQNLSVWMSNKAYQDYQKELLENRRFFVDGGSVRKIDIDAGSFREGIGAGKLNTDVFFQYRDQTYIGKPHPKLNAAGTAFAAMSTNAPAQLDAGTASALVEDDATGENLLDAGTYDYAVVPCNRYGAGKAYELTDNEVAAGKQVTFTLADNGSPEGYEATKFDIYRKLSSQTNKSDYRFLFSVAASATSIVDRGYWVPNTSDVIVFDWDFDQVFSVDQLLPMTKLPLATIGDYKWWLQKIYYTPKVFNGSKIIIFENVGSEAHS